MSQRRPLVTLRHQARDHSIRYMPFPVGSSLDLSLYLQPFRDMRPQHMLTNTHIHERTNQQTRRIVIPHGGSNYEFLLLCSIQFLSYLTMLDCNPMIITYINRVLHFANRDTSVSCPVVFSRF